MVRMIQALWDLFQKTVSPKHFYEITGRYLSWLVVMTAVLLSVGLVWGLAFAPPDYQQGNSFRIIFLHVPAASIAMSGYALMAVATIIYLVWKVKTAEMVVRAVAPIGAWFTFVALYTGSLWGRPTWGTYWRWDARLTSMLILLFLYWGVIALHNAYEDAQSGGKAAGLLILVGVVNLPIIKYSVEWWNTLHQGSTFSLMHKPNMPPEMYLPLLVCALGFYGLFALLIILRTRNQILMRESRSQWVKDLVREESERYGF